MTAKTAQRMLVVDDEPDLARGIGRILKLRGYSVQIAHSGEEAIEQAREFLPNGILMDLKMPGMDGVQAYRQIRPLCPNAFVIFMTAFSSLMNDARRQAVTRALHQREMQSPRDMASSILNFGYAKYGIPHWHRICTQ